MAGNKAYRIETVDAPLRVELDEEAIRKRLDALPNKQAGHHSNFEPWEDKIILEYWDKKTRAQLSEVLKCNATTLLRRHRELISAQR